MSKVKYLFVFLTESGFWRFDRIRITRGGTPAITPDKTIEKCSENYGIMV
jgi:hypothetical protein